MIELIGVTKSFGGVHALTEVSVRIEPGRVTALLGPNGAGKSTLLRIITGLDRPTRGTVRIGANDAVGQSVAVGALLDAGWAHPRRTARNHLLVATAALVVPDERAVEVAELLGLGAVLERPVGEFSLGTRQRLGIAVALLGDPDVLVLDEPINGLDPESIRWIRTALRYFADLGRTVLVSSHVLSEVQASADDVLLLIAGSIATHTTLEGFLDDFVDSEHGEPRRLEDAYFAALGRSRWERAEASA